MATFLFRSVTTVAVGLSVAASVWAGPYSGHSNDPGNAFDPPIAASDSRITGWATGVVQYLPAPGVIDNDDSLQTLGPADGVTASLGDLWQVSESEPPNPLPDLWFGPPDAWNGNENDLTDDYGFVGVDAPGSITMSFDTAITNGSGPDLAVFENGLQFPPTFLFADLAYVEVSSNGVNFARFPSVSTNQETDLQTPYGRNFAALDPTNIFNLAGKHIATWGTPFDLADLESDTLVIGGQVDLNDISFVRFVDIVGNGDWLDGSGNAIFDAWVGVDTGGFDLDAVGVLPEPATWLIIVVGAVMSTIGRRRRSVRA